MRGLAGTLGGAGLGIEGETGQGKGGAGFDGDDR